MYKVAIIGLGYVGLPLACLCAKKGHKVIGLDIDKNKIDKINIGVSPLDDEYIKKNLKKGAIVATDDFSKIKAAEIIVICVPTPVNKEHLPDLSFVEKSVESVSKNLEKGQLVVLESTVYPGTTEEIIKPILEKSGKAFYLAHCPERIDPGNKKWTIENIPRVVGGTNHESTEKAAEFYRTIISADIIEVKSSKEAEATKIMENTFRDVNIAFINEMAKSFDRAGIDIIDVIKGASSKPFAFMPHYPGVGVGGHCISVDPHYLIAKARGYGFEHEFLKLARKINDSMPEYTVELLEKELKKSGKDLAGAKVGVLGLAYKGNIDDIRESPAVEVIKILKEKKANVVVYDPHIPIKSDAKTLSELVDKSDYLILVTAHDEFRNMDLEKLKGKIKIIIDGRNCLDKNKVIALGIKYKGIGR
ncbi:UDP-glucose 6-dehydrogenase [archaeon GW2011_AR15]|nr:UDP-glucose 6-dehydrogenase [archaeon GW2011_AR15]MBS3103592.1 nucleotide sugar dehydrogenase [Candidatus Woesearchaeota archaeon]